MSASYCTGCKKTHKSIYWRSRYDREKEKVINFCDRWYKPPQAPFEKRVQDYSPEEVLAGVPQGAKLAETPFRKVRSKEDWSREHHREVKQLKEALK